MLADLTPVSDAVAAKLTRGGQPGTFLVIEDGEVVRIQWTGARRDRGDAERALLAKLGGYEAQSMPGLGVVVRGRVTEALDHEGVTLNGEPDESTERECELCEGLDAARAA